MTNYILKPGTQTFRPQHLGNKSTLRQMGLNRRTATTIATLAKLGYSFSEGILGTLKDSPNPQLRIGLNEFFAKKGITRNKNPLIQLARNNTLSPKIISSLNNKAGIPLGHHVVLMEGTFVFQSEIDRTIDLQPPSPTRPVREIVSPAVVEKNPDLSGEQRGPEVTAEYPYLETEGMDYNLRDLRRFIVGFQKEGILFSAALIEMLKASPGLHSACSTGELNVLARKSYGTLKLEYGYPSKSEIVIVITEKKEFALEKEVFDKRIAELLEAGFSCTAGFINFARSADDEHFLRQAFLDGSIVTKAKKGLSNQDICHLNSSNMARHFEWKFFLTPQNEFVMIEETSDKELRRKYKTAMDGCLDLIDLVGSYLTNRFAKYFIEEPYDFFRLEFERDGLSIENLCDAIRQDLGDDVIEENTTGKLNRLLKNHDLLDQFASKGIDLGVTVKECEDISPAAINRKLLEKRYPTLCPRCDHAEKAKVQERFKDGSFLIFKLRGSSNEYLGRLNAGLTTTIDFVSGRLALSWEKDSIEEAKKRAGSFTDWENWMGSD